MNIVVHQNRNGFTLVEIMIVVAIISILAGIAVPAFTRSRRRAQATRILEDIRMLDSSLNQWAIENRKSPGDVATHSDLKPFLKTGSQLYNQCNDIYGNSYGTAFTVDSLPKVPVPTFNNLSDVAPAAFWSPYN